MHEVLISYSSKDRVYAEGVLNALESHKIRVWMAPRDIVPGTSYFVGITEAIKKAKIVIVIVSAHSQASKHVENEINYATKVGATILPFRIEDTPPNAMVEYFLSTQHWLDAITPPIEAYIKKLVEAVETLLLQDAKLHLEEVPESSKEAHEQKADFPKMVTYQELISKGYTPLKIAEKLVNNDYELYQGIDQENEGDAEQWAAFLESDPQTFQYMVNDEYDIIGDWSILAMNEQQYERMLKGDMCEAEFSPDEVESLLMPGEYHVFILNMSVNTEYRSMATIKQLVDNFIKQMTEYAEYEIFFDDLVVNVFRKDQHAFYRSLGFEFVCEHRVFGNIFHLSFKEYPKKGAFAKATKLKELYEQR